MARNKVRNIVIGLLVCSFILTANVVISVENVAKAKLVGYKKWKEFKKKIKEDKSVVRYYTFEEGQEVSNEVRNEGKLVYTDASAKPGEPFAEELSFADGRWSEKKAVRLDQCAFKGDIYNIENKNFTVELWVKRNGVGTISEGGSGSIISSASGYYGGWRMFSNNQTGELGFSLGNNKKPGGSGGEFTIRGVFITDGIWQHIVVTWDGEFVMIYLNGVLKNKKKYEGNYMEESGQSLWIGYVRYGMGSSILDFDEVIIYNRPITAEEVKEHYEVIK